MPIVILCHVSQIWTKICQHGEILSILLRTRSYFIPQLSIYHFIYIQDDEIHLRSHHTTHGRTDTENQTLFSTTRADHSECSHHLLIALWN